MYIKMGRFGRFIACSGFPECRNAKPILKKIGMACPKCSEGEIVIRTTRRRRVFYGCSRYPDCDFSVWERPLTTPCPECNGLMTLSGKRNAKCTACGHIMPYEPPDEDASSPKTTNGVSRPRSSLSEAADEGLTSAEIQAAEAEDHHANTSEDSAEEEQEEHQAAAV
jgi:DNA-directed RNA polymerase subunit M/transcription elongation factor TFIIS